MSIESRFSVSCTPAECHVDKQLATWVKITSANPVRRGLCASPFIFLDGMCTDAANSVDIWHQICYNNVKQKRISVPLSHPDKEKA